MNSFSRTNNKRTKYPSYLPANKNKVLVRISWFFPFFEVCTAQSLTYACRVEVNEKKKRQKIVMIALYSLT